MTSEDQPGRNDDQADAPRQESELPTPVAPDREPAREDMIVAALGLTAVLSVPMALFHWLVVSNFFLHDQWRWLPVTYLLLLLAFTVLMVLRADILGFALLLAALAYGVVVGPVLSERSENADEARFRAAVNDLNVPTLDEGASPDDVTGAGWEVCAGLGEAKDNMDKLPSDPDLFVARVALESLDISYDGEQEAQMLTFVRTADKHLC